MITLAINWFNASIITLLGFGIVFLLLLVLILLLILFGKIMTPKVRVPKIVSIKANDGKVELKHDGEYHEVNLPANTSAAIALALHLYYADVHDEESHVLTIKRVERRYSPWNSKIYGINNLVK